MVLLIFSFATSITTLILMLYTIFVIFPSISHKNIYLAAMQACTQKQLLFAQEIGQHSLSFQENASKADADLIKKMFTETTGYLHSPEFFKTCYEKTKQEWALQ